MDKFGTGMRSIKSGTRGPGRWLGCDLAPAVIIDIVLSGTDRTFLFRHSSIQNVLICSLPLDIKQNTEDSWTLVHCSEKKTSILLIELCGRSWPGDLH